MTVVKLKLTPKPVPKPAAKEPDAAAAQELPVQRKPFIAIFCAKPDSGKTYKSRYICQELMKPAPSQNKYWDKGSKAIDEIYAYSSTKVNGDYAWLPETQTSDHFDENALNKLIDYQNGRRDPKTKKCPGIAVMLDDMVGAIDWESKWMKHLFATHRHYGIYLFAMTQYIRAIPAFLRRTANYVFVWPQPDDESWGIIIKTWFPWRIMTDRLPKDTKKTKQIDATIDFIEETLEVNKQFKPCIFIDLMQTEFKKRYQRFFIE